MTTLDQLWYTWSAVGLEGRSRFQIRAASVGLADPSATLTNAAIRLCYYDFGRTQTQNPVSYGWADLGHRRLAFRRCAAGTDDFGRSGRFFAHVIVGDRNQLPSELLASAYFSPFWRSDDHGIGDAVTIPQVTVEEISAGREEHEPADPELSAQFCSQLLRARATGRSLAVYTAPETMMALVLAAQEVFSLEAIDRLSVSTFEAKRTSQNFDLVGLTSRSDEPANVLRFDPSAPVIKPDAADGVAKAAMFPSPSAPLSLALEIANESTDTAVLMLLGVHATLASLDAGESVEDAALMKVLEDRRTRAHALKTKGAMGRLSDLLAAGDESAWRLIRHCFTVDEQVLRLARMLGARLWQRVGEVNLAPMLTALRDLDHRVGANCVTAFLEAAEANPAGLRAIRLGDRIAIVRLLDDDLSPALREAVLSVQSSELGRFLGATDLPSVYRAFAAVRALGRGDEARRLGRLIVERHPRLLPEVLGFLEEEGSLAELAPHLLATTPPAIASPVAASLGLLGETGAATVAELVSPLLPPGPALTVAMAWAHRSGSVRAQQGLSDAMATYCRFVLGRADLDLSLPNQLLTLLSESSEPNARRWSSIWRGTINSRRSMTPRSWRHQLDRFGHDIAAMPDSHREAAAAFVLDGCLTSLRSARDVEVLMDWFAAMPGSGLQRSTSAPALVLRAATRTRRGSRTQDALVASIEYIAAQIQARRLRLARDQLPEVEHQLARDLARSLSSVYLYELDSRITAKYPRAKKWWKSVRPKPRNRLFASER